MCLRMCVSVAEFVATNKINIFKVVSFGKCRRKITHFTFTHTKHTHKHTHTLTHTYIHALTPTSHPLAVVDT